MGENRNEAKERAPNKRERAAQARGRRRSAQGTLDWSQFAWQQYAALAVALASEGGAIRLGATRDGGAWALGIYLDNDYATEYIKPTEDCSEAVLEIAEAWLGEKYVAKLAEANRSINGL